MKNQAAVDLGKLGGKASYQKRTPEQIKRSVEAMTAGRKKKAARKTAPIIHADPALMGESRLKAIELHNQNLSQIEIARELNVSRQRVHQMLTGYSTIKHKGNLKEELGDICMKCESKGSDIHHKDGNSRHNFIDNLEILCKDCHYLAHN